MSVDDEGPTAGMSRRSAGGFAVADLAQHRRVHPRAVVVLHRQIAATVSIAGGDLGIHRGLEALRIDRVVIQSSGQANRPQRAPASGGMA